MNPTPEPLLLNFESDTTCSVGCTFCQQPHLKQHRRATWSQLLNIMYWHLPNAQEVNPFGLQEPTLEPRLSAILSNCKIFNRHAKTSLYSTLTHYDPAVWRRIIHHQSLDELHVSFYGVNKRVCETLQPNLDFTQTQTHIKSLVKLRRKMRWRKPRIFMHLIITPETCPHANKFQIKWQQVVDGVAFTHYDSWCGSNPYNATFEDSVWGEPLTERLPCHRLWSMLVIHADGTVVPCCLDAHNTMPMGNIHTNREAFYSEAFNKLRVAHVEGKWNQIQLCRNCSLWRHETPPGWIQFWQTKKPVTYAVNR